MTDAAYVDAASNRSGAVTSLTTTMQLISTVLQSHLNAL